MNWKAYADKKNAETYVLPQGWDSRETVAAQLDCSPEKVDDHLRPGLKSGEIQKQQFRVWDANLKRLIMVVAYAKSDIKTGEDVVAKAKALKAEGKSYREIGAALGFSGDKARSILRRAA